LRGLERQHRRMAAPRRCLYRRATA
jgi:hypothetical protein